MVGFGGVMLMMMAVLGGAWGWHVGTKRLYRRSSFSMADGRAIPRRRWRKVERYLLAALYAATVAVGAAIVVALLAKR